MNQSPLDQTIPKQPKAFSSAAAQRAVKTEILDGRPAPKQPANRWHNLIAANFAVAIGSRIARNSCEIYAGDMQVKLGKNSVGFPDLVVVAGEPNFADESQEVLHNPSLVIEIISNLASSAGRTQKVEAFLAVPSIKEFLLVNQDDLRIEHYARQNAKQWIYRIYNERDDVISLDSISCKLSLAEVYAQVRVKESELSSRAIN